MIFFESNQFIDCFFPQKKESSRTSVKKNRVVRERERKCLKGSFFVYVSLAL